MLKFIGITIPHLSKAIGNIILHHCNQFCLLLEVVMVCSNVLVVLVQPNMLLVEFLVEILVSELVGHSHVLEGNLEFIKLGLHMIQLRVSLAKKGDPP